MRVAKWGVYTSCMRVAKAVRPSTHIGNEYREL